MQSSTRPSRTEESLVFSVRSSPADAGGWLVLADWLEEQGDPRSVAVRTVPQLIADWNQSKSEISPSAHDAAVTEILFGCGIDRPALEGRLAHCNGRRRTRTVTLERFVSVLAWAIRGGRESFFVADSTVANSYKYPAVRTCVVAARRTDGTWRVEIDDQNAKKGCSPSAWAWGAINRQTPESIRQWADK